MGTYKTRIPNGTEIHAPESTLIEFAAEVGLDNIAHGRYSKLFVFKLWLYIHVERIETSFILEELRALEGLPNKAVATKPATQFKRPPLQGLWHKHFFSARFVAHNIAVHNTPKRVTETVERALDPAKSPTGRSTPGMIEEMAYALTHGALGEREQEGKLTGEWIVFAKHEGHNYYLTLDIHPRDKAGDQKIHDEISRMAYAEFPFLAPP